MHRRTTFVLLMALLLVTIVPLVAQAQAEVRVEIISPGVGERVRGRVPIIGSAVVPDFQFYKVEFGLGPNPSQWAVIGVLHNQPVINNQLEVWDTTVLPDDVYTLRVTGVKNDGNWEEFHVRNIVIANQEPVQTPTPTATPTPEGWEEPEIEEETPTIPEFEEATPTPRPTMGVQIIAPTAELSAPTATPVVGGSGSGGVPQLPFDGESLGQSFCFGGVAMGAVFVLLGLVFGLRRLL